MSNTSAALGVQAGESAPCQIAAAVHRMCYPTPRERRREEHLLQRLGYTRALPVGAGGFEPYPLTQDPDDLLEKLLDDPSMHTGRMTAYRRAKYLDAIQRFVSHGLSGDKLTRTAAQFAELFEAALEQRYSIDNDATQAIQTSSFVAPRLRWARLVPQSLRGLLDWSERIVVKEYAAVAALVDDRERRDVLTDLAVDILVGALAANALVTDFADVVTPHFAYQVDWFLAPSLRAVVPRPDALFDPTYVGDTPNLRKAIAFQPDTVSQYVVVERGDVQLADLFASTRTGPTKFKYGADLNLYTLRSVLAQITCAREAAFDVAGLVTQDGHAGNILVRSTRKEHASPLTGKAWFYTRGARAGSPLQGRAKMRIPAAEHRDLFVEIIDFGRARAVVRTPPGLTRPGRPESMVIGNPIYHAFGIRADAQGLDESWDVRRLGIDLLFGVNGTALLVAGGDHGPAATSLLTDYKHAVIVMANALHLVLTVIEYAEANARAARDAVRNDDKTGKAAEDARIARVEVMVAELRETVSTPGLVPYTHLDALPPEYIMEDRNQAARFYDAIASIMRSSADTDDLFTLVVFDTGSGEGRGFFSDHARASGANPRLTPRWCLDHLPFFAPLFDVAPHEHEIRDGTGLMLGVVHADDMLADPRLGTLRAVALAGALASCSTCGRTVTGRAFCDALCAAHATM